MASNLTLPIVIFNRIAIAIGIAIAKRKDRARGHSKSLLSGIARSHDDEIMMMIFDPGSGFDIALHGQGRHRFTQSLLKWSWSTRKG